jgi:hypothetical protein
MGTAAHWRENQKEAGPFQEGKNECMSLFLKGNQEASFQRIHVLKLSIKKLNRENTGRDYMSRKVLILLFVFAAFVFGLAATWVSGFLYTKGILREIEQRNPYTVGVSQILGYGFPWCWMKVAVVDYPNDPSLYSYSLRSFVLDVGFWSLIAGAILAAAAATLAGLKCRAYGQTSRK